MPVDANLALQASTTKTAPFQGTPLVLPSGTPRRGLKARVLYSAASVTSGTGSAQFGLDVSYDGGATWTVGAFQSDAVALSTTAVGNEIYIPFEVSPKNVANGVQIRPTLAALSGTGATVTYQMDISLARP